MKTKKVIVVPHDDNWFVEFEKIKAKISTALGSLALSIEHVGSTSVKDLWAKPIIDIDVVIFDRIILPTVIQRLGQIGYRYEGDLGIKDREAFCHENKPELMLHHLYVCPQDSEELQRHIKFRDYLRCHLDVAQEYSQIKREGAALYPENIDAYIRYKDAVIEKIYNCCGL